MTSPVLTPMPMARCQLGRSALSSAILACIAECAEHRPALGAVAHEHGQDLITDELVDVALVLLDDRGEVLEVEVEHLDHQGGLVLLGEGGVAADVAKQHGGALARAAQLDVLVPRKPDGGHRAAGDEPLKLEPLGETDDHLVHAAGEVADLVVEPDAPDDADREVAFADLGRRPVDLQDRPADRESQRHRTQHRDGEARRTPPEQAAGHLLDREVGVALGPLHQERPPERPRERVGAEHDLAVRAGVGLDPERARGRRELADSPRRR